MKIRLLLPAIAAFVLFASGCSTVNKSHLYSPVGISVQSALEADIDVDVSKKISGKSTAGYLFGFIKTDGDSKYADGYGGHGRVGTTKSAAAYKAISSGNGDVLVSPQYNIKVDRYFFFTRITVDVEGYQGKIKAFKKKDEKPLSIQLSQ